MTTIITGGVFSLAGFVATPIVNDEKTRTVFSAIGFAGVVLALPVGGILGAISGSSSESDVKFMDPTTRPELRDKIR